MNIFADFGTSIKPQGNSIGSFAGAVKQQRSAAAPAFVGALDTLIAQGATLRAAYSVRRLLSSYTGNACRLRGNGTGSPVADIPFLSDGSLDLDAANALATQDGGLAAFWHTAYDQAELVDAVQTVEASQPIFGTSFEAKGSMGGTNPASTYLNMNLGTITLPSFFQ